MKNFNRRSSHGHYGSKRCELAQHTDTHMDYTHSLTQLHQHSYNHNMRSASSTVTEFGIKFYFEGTQERGSKLEYPEKNPYRLKMNTF